MENSSNNCIFIRHNECFEKLPYNTICYIEASGSYCNIYTTDNKKLTISHSLGDIAGFLCPHTFIRVHRSYIININHVDKYADNSFFVYNRMIPIGRMYKQEALSHFNIVM